MKKVLFIDRDGTVVIEPPLDYQLDSFEKLEFYPGVFKWLSRIAEELDYELVMITNQDGLGTVSFPEETFWPVQNFIIESFRNEGVCFSRVFIDKSFPEDNLPTRKPGTAMLTEYLKEDIDLSSSFVIGDRESDLELAQNLGAKSILLGVLETSVNADLKTTDWKSVYEYLKMGDRQTTLSRQTKETDIQLELNLDGTGKADINTGIKFFDHMLEQIARHGGLDLKLIVQGDLEVDEHHTIEDTAIVLGEAFSLALRDKVGIERYGFCLPMDDCLAQVAIDFGGRSWIEWEAEFKREMIGKMPSEMFFHFFKSFTDGARCNLNIKAEGTNEHHKIESIFKAFAKAIGMAKKRDVLANYLPSTKGVLI